MVENTSFSARVIGKWRAWRPLTHVSPQRASVTLEKAALGLWPRGRGSLRHPAHARVNAGEQRDWGHKPIIRMEGSRKSHFPFQGGSQCHALLKMGTEITRGHISPQPEGRRASTGGQAGRTPSPRVQPSDTLEPRRCVSREQVSAEPQPSLWENLPLSWKCLQLWDVDGTLHVWWRVSLHAIKCFRLIVSPKIPNYIGLCSFFFLTCCFSSPPALSPSTLLSLSRCSSCPQPGHTHVPIGPHRGHSRTLKGKDRTLVPRARSWARASAFWLPRASAPPLCGAMGENGRHPQTAAQETGVANFTQKMRF